jgi:hypothetical protein
VDLVKLTLNAFLERKAILKFPFFFCSIGPKIAKQQACTFTHSKLFDDTKSGVGAP